jgi:hypothetical protein
MKQELPSPIAKQAFASWHEKVLANDPEIVRMAMKVVASRTAAGPVECPSALAPALTKRMGAIRPATLRAIDAALEDPVTQLSWRALVLCEKDPTTAGLRAAPLTRTKTSWFGPRRAAIAALGIAVERLPTVDEAAANEWGVVASVDKPRDGVVRVHLEGRKWHEPVQRCRETRRIDGISDDGRLIYREICRVVGRTVHRTAPDPLLVDADVAKKLAPGRGIRVRTVNPGSGREWIDGKVVSGTGAPRPAKIESIFTDAKALADGTGVREWLGFELARGS